MQKTRTILSICVFSVFTATQASAAPNPQLLVGKWECNTKYVEMYEVNLTSQHDFSADGSLTSSADVILAMPESSISVGYHLLANGNWGVKGDELTVQGKVTSIKNTLYPEWDKMLNLKQLIPENLKGTATIKHLDATSLVVSDRHTGRDYTCSKI